MKSIRQNAQLGDKELKGILNNDPELMRRFVDGCLGPSGLLSAAGNFAALLGEKMREAFQVMVERTVSEEFFSMLEEAASEGKDTSRNGYYGRKIRTSLGDFSIQIPRARFLEFTTKLLKKYGHDLDDLGEKVMSLYRGGMSENDIVKALAETEGTGVSASTIQRIVHATVGDVSVNIKMYNFANQNMYTSSSVTYAIS